jgi:hypothetical protein
MEKSVEAGAKFNRVQASRKTLAAKKKPHAEGDALHARKEPVLSENSKLLKQIDKR